MACGLGVLAVPAYGHENAEDNKDVDSLNQVLLVDDNPLQLRVREAVLRNAGFRVSIATNADSALATLRTLRSRIGVIVTDHVMPGCSGPEFVRKIRGEGDWIPVIVLSGLPEAMPEYDGLEVAFRAKPFPPLELIELVRSSLDKSRPQAGAA
jgi:DNA-binding response OmpR family regulator